MRLPHPSQPDAQTQQGMFTLLFLTTPTASLSKAVLHYQGEVISFLFINAFSEKDGLYNLKINTVVNALVTGTLKHVKSSVRGASRAAVV